MRIAYLLSWSRPGREASHAQSLATAAALARHGHEVTLVMPRRLGDTAVPIDGLTVVQRPARWVSENFLASALWLRRAFRDPVIRASDLLLTRMPMIQVMGAASPVPFAFDHYRRWPDDLPFIRPLVRRTARSDKCMGLILHSQLAADSYRRAGVPAEKILVAYNGADPAPAAAPADLPRDRPVALYAGRINAAKGLDLVLQMARARPSVLFALVGSEGEGPIEQAARALPNVLIVPWQENVAPWLAAADVLLIPPASAPLERHRTCVLPIKLFAYLAAGRPILAPAAPDTGELLVDGENAVLVPPDDVGAAVAGLDRILADPVLSTRLGERARRLAEGLTWDSRAGRISAFLQRSA